jgi:hypothetical protein
MTSRRAFSIGFAAVVGGVLAASLGGLAVSNALSDSNTTGQPEAVVAAPEKPLSESLRAFSSPRGVTDTVPAAVASELQSMLSSAPVELPARLRVGALRLDQGRRLLGGLGPHNAALYAVPTASGELCLAFTGGPSGCEEGFNISPISFSSFDPDGLGVGEPFTVYGLVPNEVTRIDVMVAGKAQAALLENNAFYYRLADPADWPEAINATFGGGRVETVTLAPPPKRP